MSATPQNNRSGRKTEPGESDEDKPRAALWEKKRAGDRQAYEDLVDSYLPLVKVTVSRMAINLPSFISREELYSAGCVGLVSAVERYDPGRDAKFTTYAITRIRGSVLDELRSHDVLGRVVRDRVNRIERVESELLSRSSVVSPEDIAEAAGLTMDEYWDAEMGAQAAKRISLSESSASGDSRRSLENLILSTRDDNPGARMEAEEILEIVMGMLTEKEKQLVVMYYEEELTLKEIGELLKVTESRVCQIHGAMIQKIRARLGKMGIPV